MSLPDPKGNRHPIFNLNNEKAMAARQARDPCRLQPSSSNKRLCSDLSFTFEEPHFLKCAYTCMRDANYERESLPTVPFFQHRSLLTKDVLGAVDSAASWIPPLEMPDVQKPLFYPGPRPAQAEPAGWRCEQGPAQLRARQAGIIDR
jgi:hypothetical protein